MYLVIASEDQPSIYGFIHLWPEQCRQEVDHFAPVLAVLACDCSAAHFRLNRHVSLILVNL